MQVGKQRDGFMRRTRPAIAGFEDEGRTTHQGMRESARSWKGQGNRTSPRASRRNAVLLTP